MTLRSYVNMARQGQFGTHIILLYEDGKYTGRIIRLDVLSFSGVKTAIMP